MPVEWIVVASKLCWEYLASVLVPWGCQLSICNVLKHSWVTLPCISRMAKAMWRHAPHCIPALASWQHTNIELLCAPDVQVYMANSCIGHMPSRWNQTHHLIWTTSCVVHSRQRSLQGYSGQHNSRESKLVGWHTSCAGHRPQW